MGKNTIIYLISLSIVAIRNVDSLISDQRACFDEECSEYLSKAKTLINYPSNEEYILSFKANEFVKVFSKSAGNRPDLWGVEINGKRGYAPKKFLRESKIINKPSVNVLTEIYELNNNGEIVLKKVKDRSGADKRKSQNVAGNVQSTPTEALPSNDKLKPSSVTDASFMPTVDNLKVDATPTYQVIDGTTIPNDSYETSTQAVNIEKEPVQQQNYEVHEDEDEMVDLEDEDEEGFDGDDEEEEEEEDSGEEAEKTDDTSTIVETSREIKKLNDLEENIIPPQTIEISKDSDVNIDGALSNNSALDNSVDNSTKDIINADNIEENSDINKLPIVNNLADLVTEHKTENINPINNFLPKETVSAETPIPQNVRRITENLDADSLKIIENVSNDSVANVDINNEIIPDSVNEIKNDNVLNTQMEVEVLDTKNESIESEILKTTGAEVNADSILSVPENVVANVIPEGVTDGNLDKDALNTSGTIGVVESDKVTIPSSAESNSEDATNVTKETLNNIQGDNSAIDANILKETDPAANLAIVADQDVAEQPIETGNILPSESASEAINIIKESANAEEIKTDAMNSIDKSSQIVPNLINLSEPNIYINNNEDKKYSIDAASEQKQEAAYVNSAYLTPISPLSQLVHRSLPDSYQYSNENETLDSETNDTQDDPNYPRHESTTVASSIEQGSITYKSEEITTQYPPIENTYERTQAPIYDPYKQIYNNFDSPKAEIVEEAITQKDINSNEDITEPSNILYPPETVQEMPIDSTDENESSLNIFQGIFKSVTNLFKSSEVENEQSIDVDSLNSVASDILTTNNLELQNKMNVQQEDRGHSQDFLSAIFPEKQCNAEEKISGSWPDISTDLVFWMVLSAISVLMFTLGFYYLENKKQDGKLLAMVNSLQKELLCSSKENVILREDLGITKEKLFGIEDSSFGSNEMVACLKKELTDTQLTISDLQDKLASAEEELANSTEAALELQSILDEQLNSKDTSSSSLTFTVTNLQSQLDDQQTTMNMTKAQLAAKVEENELLMMKIVDIGNKNGSIEKEVTELHDKFKEAQEESEAKTQQIRELASNQEKILQKMEEQRVAEVREIQSQMKHAKDDMDTAKVLLKARIEEVTSLQKNLKLLKLDDKSYEAIVDVSQTKAELTQAVSENTLLVEKLEVEKTAQAQLTERMNEQDAKMSQMKEQLNEAEQNALQSTSRLEVLTNYFNQKEADLLKELSTKEALWLSQQGEAMSTVDKIQSLQQEIQQYKQMSESVKRELAEQEASWRARVAALEKKSHEHWLARRAAERTSQAMEKEAQVLRQRLSGPSPNDKRVVSPLNVMDGVPDVGMMLPPGMGPMPPMPLPLPLPMPMGFLPPSAMMLPPPLPHLPPLPPHRPPPLGRLSSPPPNNNRYSPDSRYSPDRYSPDTRRSTPQHNRMRSPFSPTEARRRGYNHNGRYEDDRYYDSGDDRRLRRYDETETDLSPPPSPPPSRRLPPPQRHNNHNHKGISSGSGQSS